MKSIKSEISFGFIICSHWSVLGPVDDAPFDPRSSRDVIGVQRSVPKFTSGDRQDERMSRRSSRYKGGVTRGREEQPQGNKQP